MIVTLAIVLAEICLVLVIVLGVIGTRAWRGRRRDRAAVKTLVSSIKSNQTARVEKLAGMLKDTAQLNDKDALGKANELIKKQNKFYQDAIDLYFTRNHEVLSKLDSRLEDLLGQYQVMVTPGEGGADNAMVEQLSKDIAALSDDLEKLRAENAALTEQLKAAEHELDQLGQEYVSAFNKPKGEAAKAAPAQQAQEPSVETPFARDEDAVAEEATAAEQPAPEPTPAQDVEPEPRVEPESEVIPQPAPESEEPAPEQGPAPTASFAEDDEEEGKGILTDLDLAELLADEPDNTDQSTGKP